MFSRLTALSVLLLAGAGLLAAPAFGQNASLRVGDPVPPLDGKVRWLQGDPIPEWGSGEVYVLDFWATWCGPCIASMPEMNQIARRFKEDGVEIIGVAILPQSGATPVDEWMEQNPNRMAYNVADDIDRKAAETIFFPTGSQSIPRVMIIDRAGDLAWVGHPQEDFESSLELVVEGHLTGEKAARLAGKAQPMLAEAEALAAQGEWDPALRMIDQIIALDDYLYDNFAVIKYAVLHMQLSRHEEAREYGREVVSVSGALWDNPEQLARLAEIIVDPSKPVLNRDLELAKMAADRAVELTDGAPRARAALAATYFAMFEFDEAVEEQRKVVEGTAPDDPRRSNHEKTLEMYESARQNAKRP